MIRTQHWRCQCGAAYELYLESSAFVEGGLSEKARPEGAVGQHGADSTPSVTHGDPLDVARSHMAAIKLLGGHHEPCVCPLCCAAVASLAASIKGNHDKEEYFMAYMTAMQEVGRLDEQVTDLMQDTASLRADNDALRAKIVKMRVALGEVNACFVGRDPEGAPAGDGTYWVGHSCALKVWYALNPESEPKDVPEPF